MAMPVALTIAGSDSGGGAGIQADLKTFGALGVYGASVITAVTAQNTLEVTGIHDLPADFVALQLDTVARDLPIQAIKTGMLSNPAIIRAVSARLQSLAIERLVVDPVMVAKGGAALLRKEAEVELIQGLLPLAYVVTPNLAEAEVLAAMPIRNLDEMEQAARRIHARGPRYVVVKGGHLEGPPVDILFDGRTFQYFEGRRIETTSLHGTGCTFASAITAELAKGAEVTEAVRSAKVFISDAIRLAEPIGHGFGPTHHFGALYNQAARYDILLRLDRALAELRAAGVAALIPAAPSNLGEALAGATTVPEVAAWEGQIVRLGEDVCPVGSIRFGASPLVATLILTAMRADPMCRSAMNIRCGDDIMQAADAANLSHAQYVRREAPSGAQSDECLMLAWGVAQAVDGRAIVPDIIHDPGDAGKEAMVWVLGRDATDVAGKILALRHHLLTP
jgi:hydroxymethylpyrimidine kinase/phosphomethylpyrimidine kinase